MEYKANVDVKVFKSPGYLYRDTIRSGTEVIGGEIRDGWLQIVLPDRFATYWGELRFFSEITPPEPTISTWPDFFYLENPFGEKQKYNKVV